MEGPTKDPEPDQGPIQDSPYAAGGFIPPETPYLGYAAGGLIPAGTSYPFFTFYDSPDLPAPRDTTPAFSQLVAKAQELQEQSVLKPGEKVVRVSKERGEEILREVIEQAQNLDLAKQGYLFSGEEREYTVTIRVMADGVAQALDRAKQVPVTFRPADIPEWFRSVWVGISDDYETTGFAVSAND